MSQPPSGVAESRKVGTTRATRPKVRTGCITCKIRRVKCDEGKPACRRCSSTGRRCDGYAIAKKEEQGSFLTPPVTPASSVSTDTAEVSLKLAFANPTSLSTFGLLMEARALDYFQSYTACKFAGWLDNAFWTWHLPHVGNIEPTIRHAIIAVASAHEQMEVLSDTTTAWDLLQLENRRRFALHHYNKAVSELTKHVSSGHDSTRVTLVCCLLFICLEFIRGNFNTAEIHINSGLQILSRWTHERQFEVTGENQSLEENLAQSFSSLGLQASLCGKPLSVFYRDIPILNTINLQDDARAFPNLPSARLALDRIILESLRLVRLGAEVAVLPLCSPTREFFERDVAACLSESTLWSRKFDDLIAQISHSMTFADKQGAGDLRILHLAAQTWVDSCHTPFEAEFDVQLDKYERIMELGEQLFYEEDGPYQSPLASFTFDKGFLPPVYFVAMTCRHRILRRRAVALLKKASPKRVGMWNAELLAACAERIIEIEEEGMPPLSEADDEWPAEEKRIYDSDGIASQDYWVPPEVAMAGFVDGRSESSKEGMRAQRVKFMLRPDGVDGKWKIREEVIWW